MKFMMMPKKINSILLLVTLSVSSFAASKDKNKKKKQDPTRIATQVPVVSPTPAPTPNDLTKQNARSALAPRERANGSLFFDGAAAGNLFSDFKPRSVGDLVFVDVVESSAANVASNANRKRDSGTLGGLATATGALPSPGAAVAAGVVGALGVRKFEGSGATARTSAVKARITARVVEVLPNGDLRIEALKVVRINKEDEQLMLSGIVRARDVAADNSVPTTSIGNLYLQLNGKGVASADNEPGWLFRLFEKVTPF
jgi:flagellar L-ring protein precursor FlgH